MEKQRNSLTEKLKAEMLFPPSSKSGMHWGAPCGSQTLSHLQTLERKIWGRVKVLEYFDEFNFLREGRNP